MEKKYCFIVCCHAILISSQLSLHGLVIKYHELHGFRYNICEGKLRLRGRVLKDLKLGDALFLLDYANPVKAQEFIIEKISAYRHELDEICEGMTCELITLENKIDLKEDCIFYVED